MKKCFSGVFIVLLLLITSISPLAANTRIVIDGVGIPSDMEPEIRNNRTMVPLRVISENLGANVHWSGSTITLTKDDMQVILKQNSHTVLRNGKPVQLDVEPYIKNGRTLVPIRFLAETFDCSVNYKNFTVTVTTKPLVINTIKIAAIQHEYHMTMGGIVQQMKGNSYNKAFYDILMENKGQKVEAPANYSWHIDLDHPGSYYKVGQYDFMNLEGKSIKRYDIYSLVGSFPAETLEGYPEVLLYDATANQWYLFPDNALQSIDELLNSASKNGFLTIISNTVV
ncbi:copper amine oxidase N-terminal domain-containing protein [Ureibacillus sinduriensis]|uniref:Copper amine oxidase n=1 Tax=Ureibacillus sinduriensis BLB-1 = JCM 15800 TaxID=1384057 RepID=A0A0A3HPZ1_9BACL|nr:copper amine oxidase N-terminal domain-containing protein [Ureibacillus sinduriensis]KGR74651.1 copper amine oxidase [Ureibacillus sinduriensis BLB-1 = JCM 15800]